MAVDISKFQAQRRAVNSGFAANRAASDYSRGLAQRRGSRSLADGARSFGRQVPKLNASLGRRGLSGPGVRSGVASGAMQRFAGDYQRDQFRMGQDIKTQDRQYDLDNARMTADRDGAMADIEAAKQREIALAALNIKAVLPQIG